MNFMRTKQHAISMQSGYLPCLWAQGFSQRLLPSEVETAPPNTLRAVSTPHCPHPPSLWPHCSRQNHPPTWDSAPCHTHSSPLDRLPTCGTHTPVSATERRTPCSLGALEGCHSRPPPPPIWPPSTGQGAGSRRTDHGGSS